MGSVSYRLKGRLSCPSLPVGDDGYPNLSSQRWPTGRNLRGNRSVRRSGTTSSGTDVLVFCLRMRKFPLTLVNTIFVRTKWNEYMTVFTSFTCASFLSMGQTSHLIGWWELHSKINHFVTSLPYYSLCKISKNGNYSSIFIFFQFVFVFVFCVFFF